MPFLLIPIFFIVIGVVMICILGLVFGLIHIFFWPVVIGLFVWWLLRRNDHHQRPHYHHTTRHPDWQEGLHQRKEAHNVHEESSHKSDDDWSDF